MEDHMAYIVLSERRPFCYRDFLKSGVNRKESDMAYGTFRNKISKLKKSGTVELSYYSSCAFYTLKGHKFGKPMTINHMMVKNNPVYKMIQDLPFDKQSIHDIRLRFKVSNIWRLFSINSDYYKNNRSQDITIPTWSKSNALIRTVIHKTDTVNVTIACTMKPIPLDVNGIIKFFNLLVRIEERLQTIIDNSLLNQGTECISMPEYAQWIVTMWHFGRDASIEYTGERYCITLENVEEILTRVYVKDFNGKNRVRIERQEYPQKTLVDAIEEKLGITNCN